ncbi:MAG: DUF202 domain-containing protein [Actinomycetota bacterium]
MNEPDQNNDPQVARTILANERTFLAWARTSLALVSAGVAVARFLPPGQVEGLGKGAGVILIILGTTTLVLGYRGWGQNQTRILQGTAIGRQTGPRLLAAGMVVAVVTALAVTLTGNA